MVVTNDFAKDIQCLCNAIPVTVNIMRYTALVLRRSPSFKVPANFC